MGRTPTGKPRGRPRVRDVVVKAEPCGAKTRGKAKYPTCHRPAGWGTDHPGQGKCKLHGGATPIRHGRYSALKHERLRQIYEEQAANPDPLNIFDELAMTRALLIDFIERYQVMTDAILAWHESYEVSRVPFPEEKVMAFEGVVNEWEIAIKEGGPEPTARQLDEISVARGFLKLLRGPGANSKPRVILDIADAYKMASEVTKIAERQWKRQDANAISRKDLNRVIGEMGRVVQHVVPDQEALKAIRDGWMAIAI